MRRMPITLYIDEVNQLLEAICGSSNYGSEFSEFVENAGTTLSRKDKS